jgi:hypothetical protein
MKRIYNCLFVYLFLTIYTNISYSQTTSETIDWFWTTGKISRTSSIIDGNRYYDGPFSYSGKGANFPNTMTAKGSYKKTKFDGDFILTRQGPLYGGSCEYLAKGKFIRDTFEGQWTFKSKKIIDGLTKDENYSHDKKYTINFSKGVVLSCEKINFISNSKFLWQGDKLGFLNGSQIIEGKENGYLVKKETYYVHGIKVWSKKTDVSSGQLLGKIEYFADTSLINEQNFNYNTLTFTKPNAKSLEKEIEQIQIKINEKTSVRDSIKMYVLSLKNILSDSIKTSNKLATFIQAYDAAKKDSLKLEESIRSYDANDKKIALYNLIKECKTFNKNPKLDKSFDKLKKNLVAEGKINVEEDLLFFDNSTNLITISISKDNNEKLSIFKVMELSAEQSKILNSIISKNKIIFDQSTDNISYQLTGLNKSYYDLIVKKSEFKDQYFKHVQDINKAKEEMLAIKNDANKIYTSMDNHKQKVNELSMLESNISKLKNEISSNSFKIKKCTYGDCCIIYSYFTDGKELGDLIEAIGPAGTVTPCEASEDN